MESRIYRLFQFDDYVFERCGGFFEVGKLAREKFFTFLRLREFFYNSIPVPYPRLLYLYFHTLYFAPPLFLHRAFFRKGTFGYPGRFPISKRDSERDALAHFLIKTSACLGDVRASRLDRRKFPLCFTNGRLQFHQVALRGESLFPDFRYLLPEILKLACERRLFFLHTRERIGKRFYALFDFFIRMRRVACETVYECLNAPADRAKNFPHHCDILRGRGLLDALFYFAGERAHMRHGDYLLHGHVGRLEGAFGAAELAREFFAFPPRIGELFLPLGYSRLKLGDCAASLS